MNKLAPFNRAHNRDLNITKFRVPLIEIINSRAFKRRRFINHGSTLNDFYIMRHPSLNSMQSRIEKRGPEMFDRNLL